MITEEEKAEYLELIKRYNDLLDRMDKFIAESDQEALTTSENTSGPVDISSSDTSLSSTSQSDAARLAELRAKLNIS